MSRLLRKFAFCSKTDTVTTAHSELPECAVCQDPPTKPCTVPCGNNHVFCQACLQGLVTHNHYRSHFPCPLCRKRVRIPLGGVAVFRRGKGGTRARFLAGLPSLRPRCRRRSRSADSMSSGWPDDLSLSDFGQGVVVGDIEPAYGSDDDDDDDDDNDVDDENYINLRMASSSHQQDPDAMLDAEGGYLDSWLNSLDPEQVMILEEIQRQREQAAQLAASETSEPESAPSSGEAVQDHDAEGDVRGGEHYSGSGSAGEEEGEMNVLDLPDDEDLPMRLVLQMIADMVSDDDEEEEERRDSFQRAASVNDEDSYSTVCEPSVSHTTDETADALDGSPVLESSSLHGNPLPLSAHDWKLKTITDTTIPRPKITFALASSRGEQPSRLNNGDEERPSSGLPPQNSPQYGIGVAREMELQGQKHAGNAVSQHSVDAEGKPTGLKEGPVSAELGTTSADPQSSGTQSKTERNAGGSNSLSFIGQSHRISCSEDSKFSKTKTELSEELILNPVSFKLMDTRCYTPPTEEEQPKKAYETTDPAFIPADWRCQELERSPGSSTKQRKTASEMFAYEDQDAEMVLSEEPVVEWVRRIRSLQHRRRGGPHARRPVARSHSHNGGKAGPVRDRQEDGQMDRDRETDGRGEDEQGGDGWMDVGDRRADSETRGGRQGEGETEEEMLGGQTQTKGGEMLQKRAADVGNKQDIVKRQSSEARTRNITIIQL